MSGFGVGYGSRVGLIVVAAVFEADTAFALEYLVVPLGNSCVGKESVMTTKILRSDSTCKVLVGRIVLSSRIILELPITIFCVSSVFKG